MARIKELIIKYKDILLYLIFGGLTTVVSIGTFALFYYPLGMNELVANVFSWIFAVLFAFFTNRIWVFHAPTKTAGEFLGQMAKFFGGRLLTLVIEELILYVFITRMGWNSMLVKVVAQVIVVVSNYIISKLLVFTKKTAK